jgi:hypothetical protein
MLEPRGEPESRGASQGLASNQTNVYLYGLALIVATVIVCGCSRQPLGHIQGLCTHSDTRTLTRSATYRSGDVWVFCASDLQVWSSPFSQETAPVGPALCIIWNRRIEDATAQVGPTCQLLIFQFYQPSYLLEIARAGEVMMCIEKTGGIAIRFSCRAAPEEQPPGRDLPEASLTSYAGEARFVDSARPLEEMPFRMRGVVEDRLRRLSTAGQH